MPIIRFGLDIDPCPLPRRKRTPSIKRGRDKAKLRAKNRRCSARYYQRHAEVIKQKRRDRYVRTGR